LTPFLGSLPVKVRLLRGRRTHRRAIISGIIGFIVEGFMQNTVINIIIGNCLNENGFVDRFNNFGWISFGRINAKVGILGCWSKTRAMKDFLGVFRKNLEGVRVTHIFRETNEACTNFIRKRGEISLGFLRAAFISKDVDRVPESESVFDNADIGSNPGKNFKWCTPLQGF